MCSIVRLDDNGVSQAPSPSQSQRACRVALGSGSVDEEASKKTELSTRGNGGAKANRAVGPDVAIVTAIDAVWDSVPFVPVMTTVYEPMAEPLNVQADVWVPLMLAGTHEIVTPAGAEAGVRSTAPLEAPSDRREIVEKADWPATNETAAGLAVIEKAGTAGAVTG